MRLSPIDIVNRSFQRSIIGGYNLDDVADFQNEVANALEELIHENAQLKESNQQLKQQIDKYVRIEESLQNALLMAQRAAEEARATAKREAELTVREADARAREMMDETQVKRRQVEDEMQTKRSQVEDEITRLRRERERFEAEFTSMLQTYMNWLRSPAPAEAPNGTLPPAVTAN